MVTFQACAWHPSDASVPTGEYDRDGTPVESTRFNVQAFGRTEDGRTVSINVVGFTPYFFLKIPTSLLPFGSPALCRAVRSFVSDALRLRMHQHRRRDKTDNDDDESGPLLDVAVKSRRDYWGFHGTDKTYFLRLTFSTQAAFRFASQLFAEPVAIPKLNAVPLAFVLYESNVEPLLRWMHTRDVDAAGWIRVEDDRLRPSSFQRTTCQLQYQADWRDVFPEKSMSSRSAPFVIASFDIECDSSHGDFPQAIKSYHRTARELAEWFRVASGEWKCEDDRRAWRDGPLRHELAAMFDGDTPHLSRVFPSRRFSSDEARKSLTTQHLADIVSYLDAKGVAYVCQDGAVSREQRVVEKLGGVVDAETGQRTADGIFPPLCGDAVIQIGTTTHRYGRRDCDHRVVFVLGTCDDVEGATVYAFDDERALLMAWQQWMVALDPDVVTGFNVFGFDWAYLVDRARELGIDERFRQLGRLKDHGCRFVTKALSSAAYGDNTMRYVDAIGRVNMDLFKIVQRDHKLDSYKLDAVAFHFTGERKDDVSPADIFRLQKGTAADRSTIARYCVQDCLLVNRLVIKLDTLSSAIGMANVCSVPMAYIFQRGQGIKIFSLVAKVCRVEGFTIKTVRPPRDLSGTVDDSNNWYEGAVVLEPQTGIYLDDPVAVLDYASLYPSSMIAENLSHDTIVLDDKYADLPGVEYSTIKFDDFDADRKRTGTQTVVRFAQNPQGILPKILEGLLAQRRATRRRVAFKRLVDVGGKQVVGSVRKETEDAYEVAVDGNGDDVAVVPKATVVEISDAYDAFQKSVLDGLQLAYKVTANSLYGQCGASTSPIFLREVAACTTATGRTMLLKAKAFMEKEFGTRTVYGDSVTGDTPLILKFPDGSIDVRTIETLCEESDWMPYREFVKEGHSKQQGRIDAQVWADGVWADVRRVIRHKTDKRMFRINTFRGCVDVTEDHSLIGIDGEEIKPVDCVCGETELLHSFPEDVDPVPMTLPAYRAEGFKDWSAEFPGVYECKGCGEEKGIGGFHVQRFTNGAANRKGKCRLCVKRRECERWGVEFDGRLHKTVLKYDVPERTTLTASEAWVMGMFFGDGSCGDYECPTGRKRSWAINNQNLEFLEKAKKCLEECEDADVVTFKVLDTLASSGVYKLVAHGAVAYMVDKYRGLFYDKDRYKKVPAIILNADRDVRMAFMQGYLTADGEKGKMRKGRWSFACKGKIGAQGLFYLMKSLGWKDVRVNNIDAKENTYLIYDVVQGACLAKRNTVLKKIELPPCDDDRFVYDIETSRGRFQGGVGELVEVNTDSCCLVFPTGHTGKDAVLPTIRMAKEAAAAFNATLKRPHELEYEKTFWPFVLFAKKRYCAHKYEHDDEHYKLNSMGIVLKRRDNAPIVKRVFGGCLDIILEKRDVPGSIAFLRDALDQLVAGRCPLEDLVITKALRGHYADPTRIAHKVLADRMAARDPGNKPQVNDRIPFVYVRTANPNALQGDRIEHPDYVRASGGRVKVDYEFYVAHQIMKPVLQLYGLALHWIPGYHDRLSLADVDTAEILRTQCGGDDAKMRDKLASMREAEAKRLLFDPVFTRLEAEAHRNRLVTDFFTAKAAASSSSKKKKKERADDRGDEAPTDKKKKETVAMAALRAGRASAPKSRTSLRKPTSSKQPKKDDDRVEALAPSPGQQGLDGWINAGVSSKKK